MTSMYGLGFDPKLYDKKHEKISSKFKVGFSGHAFGTGVLNDESDFEDETSNDDEMTNISFNEVVADDSSDILEEKMKIISFIKYLKVEKKIEFEPIEVPEDF
ncbi:MAG: hypothetical protein MHPSP_002083, partial [Paramarteilia canceri]